MLIGKFNKKYHLFVLIPSLASNKRLKIYILTLSKCNDFKNT